MKVIVATSRTGNYRRYHTDPDCTRIEQMRQVRERELETLPDNVTHCDYCSGDWKESVQGEQGEQLAAKLEKMDPEEIDL